MAALPRRVGGWLDPANVALDGTARQGLAALRGER